MLFLGTTLLRKYKLAIADWNLQVEGHRGFNASLPPALTREWEAEVNLWEAAEFPKYKNSTSPYEVKGNCASNL